MFVDPNSSHIAAVQRGCPGLRGIWGGGPSPESCLVVGLRVNRQVHLEEGVRDRHENRTYCSPC